MTRLSIIKEKVCYIQFMKQQVLCVQLVQGMTERCIRLVSSLVELATELRKQSNHGELGGWGTLNKLQ